MAKNKTPKRDLARRIMSRREIELNIPVFYSRNWNRRADAIKLRVSRNQAAAHRRAELRKKVALAPALGISQVHLERRTSRYDSK